MKSKKLKIYKRIPSKPPPYFLYWGDVEKFLDKLPEKPIFNLVVTSPPYNIGKKYEKIISLNDYKEWQIRIIKKIIPRLWDDGSICWQVGNNIKTKEVLPLDYIFHPIFSELGLKLRNRIIWRFGHGLHAKDRFSGRYEVILWYTKRVADYKFFLDEVRMKQKYPGKKHYKGPRKGHYSSHQIGKNPEDVWDNIPNVKGLHVEKYINHPCQFPVGLVQRLILALTEKNDLVFDPFSGLASAGVASIITKRRFWGCDINEEFNLIAKGRLERTFRGEEKYRPHDKDLFDHTKSNLSKQPLRKKG